MTKVKLGAIITWLDTPESNKHKKFLGYTVFVHRDFIDIQFQMWKTGYYSLQ